MATHSTIMPAFRPAADGLPIVAHPDVYPRHGRFHDQVVKHLPCFVQAEPIPGLASAARRRAVPSPCDAAAHARAMNAILADLNGILAEGGARA